MVFFPNSDVFSSTCDDDHALHCTAKYTSANYPLPTVVVCTTGFFRKFCIRTFRARKDCVVLKWKTEKCSGFKIFHFVRRSFQPRQNSCVSQWAFQICYCIRLPRNLLETHFCHRRSFVCLILRNFCKLFKFSHNRMHLIGFVDWLLGYSFSCRHCRFSIYFFLFTDLIRYRQWSLYRLTCSSRGRRNTLNSICQPMFWERWQVNRWPDHDIIAISTHGECDANTLWPSIFPLICYYSQSACVWLRYLLCVRLIEQETFFFLFPDFFLYLFCCIRSSWRDSDVGEWLD